MKLTHQIMFAVMFFSAIYTAGFLTAKGVYSLPPVIGWTANSVFTADEMEGFRYAVRDMLAPR